MIEKTQAYRVGDNVYPSLLDAQKAAIELAIYGKDSAANPAAQSTIEQIVAKADEVVDILTTGPNSKPSARKIHGGTKRRGRPAKVEVPAA